MRFEHRSRRLFIMKGGGFSLIQNFLYAKGKVYLT